MADEKTKNYAFVQNTKCEYFPCHKTSNPETFNCLFCYCPLYALGDDCGGNHTWTEKGYKSCMDCGLPHSPAGYVYVIKKYPQIAELTKKNRKE